MKALRALATVTALLILTSCGGGGGGDGGGTDSAVPVGAIGGTVTPTSPTTEAKTASIDVAADVLAATRSSITRFATATGSSADGKSILLPNGAQSDGFLVMALNARGQPLLLGFLDQAGIATLSIDSTAMSLLSLVIGPSAVANSTKPIDRARQTTEYGTLTVAIRQAVAQGRAPYQDANVQTAIGAVLEATSKGAPSELSKQLTESDPSLYKSANGLWRVNASAVTPAAATLQNRSLIFWDAERRSADGATLDKLSTPLSAAELPNVLANTFPSASLAGGNANKYALRLFQTQASWKANSGMLVKELLKFATGVAKHPALLLQADKIVDNAVDSYTATSDKTGIAFVRGFLTELQFRNIATTFIAFYNGINLTLDDSFLKGLQDLSWDGLIEAAPIVKYVKNGLSASYFVVRSNLVFDTVLFDEVTDVCFDAAGKLTTTCSTELQFKSERYSALTSEEFRAGVYAPEGAPAICTYLTIGPNAIIKYKDLPAEVRKVVDPANSSPEHYFFVRGREIPGWLVSYPGGNVSTDCTCTVITPAPNPSIDPTIYSCQQRINFDRVKFDRASRTLIAPRSYFMPTTSSPSIRTVEEYAGSVTYRASSTVGTQECYDVTRNGPMCVTIQEYVLDETSTASLTNWPR